MKFMIYVVIYIVLSYGYSFIETLEWYNKYIASNILQASNTML